MKWKYKFILLPLLLVALSLIVYYREKSEADQLHHNRQRRLSHVTRDPKRRVIFNYQTNQCHKSENMKVSRVDIASNIIPNLTTLDNQMVLVTGFGSRKTYKGMGLVASIQSHMPCKKIIVYDLGIHPKMLRKLKEMCNIEVRKVPFAKYPKHVKKTDNHAWQILELVDIMTEYGGFFYAQPDMRLRAPVSMLLPHVIKQNGILTDLDNNNSITEVTHPEVFKFFGMSVADFQRDFPKAAIASEFIAAVNNSALRQTIWEPMVKCALNWKCLSPRGSVFGDVRPQENKHTHRYEFSLLTLLMYRTFKAEWIPQNDSMYLIKRLYNLVEPDSSRDFLWAHYCNPPHNEVDCLNNKRKCN